jgi:hypothetical protein
MSAQQYDNELRGVLFKNKEKDPQNPNWPDYKGNAEIAGVQYWVSAWIKTPKAGGDKFMSLSFKAKLASEVKGGTKNPPARETTDFGDDGPPF